jgi:hypothetical protein
VQRLQIAKLIFGKTGLLEDLPKCSRRQSTRMHGHVRLPAIGVAQDLVAATLSYFYKSGAKELGENFTGGVRHRGYGRARLATWLRPEPSRRESASLRPTLRSIPEQQRWLLRCLCRERLGRELEGEKLLNKTLSIRFWDSRPRIENLKSKIENGYYPISTLTPFLAHSSSYIFRIESSSSSNSICSMPFSSFCTAVLACRATNLQGSLPVL